MKSGAVFPTRSSGAAFSGAAGVAAREGATEADGAAIVALAGSGGTGALDAGATAVDDGAAHAAGSAAKAERNAASTSELLWALMLEVILLVGVVVIRRSPRGRRHVALRMVRASS